MPRVWLGSLLQSRVQIFAFAVSFIVSQKPSALQYCPSMRPCRHHCSSLLRRIPLAGLMQSLRPKAACHCSYISLCYIGVLLTTNAFSVILFGALLASVCWNQLQGYWLSCASDPKPALENCIDIRRKCPLTDD